MPLPVGNIGIDLPTGGIHDQYGSVDIFIPQHTVSAGCLFHLSETERDAIRGYLRRGSADCFCKQAHQTYANEFSHTIKDLFNHINHSQTVTLNREADIETGER